MEFPSLTREGLIRRAERQYLLEDSTLLLETDSTGAGYELYLWNHGDILQIYYDRTLMGLWLDDAGCLTRNSAFSAALTLPPESRTGITPIRLFGLRRSGRTPPRRKWM